MDDTGSARLPARLAALLFVTSGLAGLVSLPLPAPAEQDRVGLLLLGFVAIAVGAVVAMLPWGRWSRSTALVLVPVAFLLVGARHYFAGPHDDAQAVFLAVAFAWIGLVARPGVAAMFLPAAALTLVVPLLLRDDPIGPHLAGILLILTVVTLIGEGCAWMTQRVRDAEMARKRAESRFRALIERSADTIAVVDANGVFTYVSPSVRRLTGHDPDTLLGAPILGLVHPDDLEAIASQVSLLSTTSGYVAEMLVRLRASHGEWRWCGVTATNLNDDPAVAGIVANLRDVTDRKHLEEALTYQALHDPLTGLPNRTLLIDRLEQAIARTRRQGLRVAALFLDLDDFKDVNDTLGHAAGDAVLRELAGRLASATRESDTVARFGGDEFVILTEVADEEGAHRFAQRVRQAIVRPLLIDGRTHRITASIGVALAHPGIEDTDALLRAADQALYRAKRSGRDGIHAAATDGPHAASGG